MDAGIFAQDEDVLAPIPGSGFQDYTRMNIMNTSELNCLSCRYYDWDISEEPGYQDACAINIIGIVVCGPLRIQRITI